jgi:hypothetical protein
MKLEEFLVRPFKLQKMVNRLDFLETDVIGAAREQPKLYLEAARYRVAKMRARSKALAQLDVAKSEAGLRLRKKKDSEGKKKYTEPAIKEMIAADPDVAVAQKALDRAYSEEEFAKLLVEAYRYRKDALKIVVEANFAEVSKEFKELRIASETQGLQRLKQRARRKLDSLTEDDDE